ncbi:MAG: TIGR04086 family membrane protein [Defluviitaleaceae bacterium]|nr:TIGR04086 family membrane protein [Defluviitaleaceae bacterium]MCL2274671.1 TIGR04086 family membrane protein [Defluviitaleaceae bacterium]MCL2275768.1 TIGR04086 family membrane protein [Defluviitaleaceae bacterium]
MNNQEMKHAVKHLVIGVLMGFAITAIVFLGYAMLITYTDMSERSLHTVVVVTTVLSVLVAGFDAARAAPYKGWLWGMGAGFLYIAVLALIMVIMLPNIAIDGRTILTLALAILGGGLGGILGINLKK